MASIKLALPPGGMRPEPNYLPGGLPWWPRKPHPTQPRRHLLPEMVEAGLVPPFDALLLNQLPHRSALFGFGKASTFPSGIGVPVS